MSQELQAEQRVLVEGRQTIMATETSLHLSVSKGSEASAHTAMHACFSWLREVETCLTRFQPDSELCRLNEAAGSWFAVSELLFTVLEESLAAADASDGLFDPTLLTLLEELGYDRDFKIIAHRETLGNVVVEWRVPDRSPFAGAWRRIQLDRSRRRVRLPLGARLDFGGIAKGWAADEALELFFNDFGDVLINIGGDMRARGRQPDGTAWPIGVGSSASSAPQPKPDLTVLTIGSGGIATSGATDRWWYRGGQRQHHLLDPRTGSPAQLWIDQTDDSAKISGEQTSSMSIDRQIAAATALAPTAAHAEVAAKVALLRGYPAALQTVDAAWSSWLGIDGVSAAGSLIAEQAPSPYGDTGVALLLTLGTGEVVCTENLTQYLTTLGGGGNVWLA